MFSRRPRRGLFGKLFLSFTSVFIITACVVVAVAYFLQRPVGSGIGELSDSPIAQRSLGTLASVLRYGGPEAAADWLRERSPYFFESVLYVTDESLRDVLGREIPESALEQLRSFLGPNSSGALPDTVRRITTSHGDYLLFAVRIQDPPSLPKHLTHFPLGLTLSCALLLIVLVSWYLARRFTRPLEELNEAMRTFARGELQTRIAEKLRKDDADIAQLAVIFDDMAEEIQALINRQQRLFHDVSHEIRSPLARINVALALADRDRYASLSRSPALKRKWPKSTGWSTIFSPTPGSTRGQVCALRIWLSTKSSEKWTMRSASKRRTETSPCKKMFRRRFVLRTTGCFSLEPSRTFFEMPCAMRPTDRSST